MLVPKTSIPASPRTPRSWLAWLLVLVALPLFGRGPEPPLRIPLDDLGFQSLPAQFLLNGSSMFTVHFVDQKHLLLTFVTHRLIPRLPDEPEDDRDRVVDAVLLDLPSGHVLARTSWHLHDHAQYLWNLGGGHFLLRIRDTLTTFAPLINLATGQPFTQRPFLVSSERRLAALIVSPDNDFLIIESIKRAPVNKTPKTPLFGPSQSLAPMLKERDPVQINFYRLRSTETSDAVQAAFAGIVQSDSTGDIPASTAGFLAVIDQGHQHYAFDFHSYAGKVAELSPFDSSCSPAPIFVSHSEFIAFGCRGGQVRQQVGGFNMRGEEMWEQGIFGDYISPSLAYAPAGGRFALSRILLKNSVIADQPLSSDEVNAQAVIVYQTGTGKQLLRADCSPIERAGQNFTLSPDGLSLAVVHAGAIEIYSLPPLTDKDQTALKLVQASAPAENNLPVHFSSEPPTSSDANAASTPDTVDRPGPQLPAPTTTVANTSSQPSAATPPATSSAEPAQQAPPTAAPPPSQSAGDPAPEQHRLPPTLYSLPDDKPPAPPKTTPQ